MLPTASTPPPPQSPHQTPAPPTMPSNPKKSRNGVLKRKADSPDSERPLSPRFNNAVKRRRSAIENSPGPLEAHPQLSTQSTSLINGQTAEGILVFTNKDICRGRENFQKARDAFLADLAATKDAFEAGLKRATRRQNEAEDKLRAVNQEYARNLKAYKAKEEANTKLNEALQKELEVSVGAGKALQSENEALKTQNSLVLGDVRLQAASNKIAVAHDAALKQVEAVRHRHKRLLDYVDHFIQDLNPAAMKEIKRRAITIDHDLRSILTEGELVRGGLAEIGAVLKMASK